MLRDLFLAILAVVSLFFVACSDSVTIEHFTDECPDIFPDYTGVMVPNNIAPLNFRLTETHDRAIALFEAGGFSFRVKEKSGYFAISKSKWRKLLGCGDSEVRVTVQAKKEGKWIAYAPFLLFISQDEIDPYVAYRLIDPGYVLWGKMGVYQRNLTNFKQSPILENQMMDGNCINCHSFCMQDPQQMLIHVRETYPGTLVVRDGQVEKLNTKTEQTISPFVYPSWHPSGRYVAFSVNRTQQAFHLMDPNRIEVFDEYSDVVVYDVERHEAFTCEQLSSELAYETFPTFSPDGRRLYFCTAEARPVPAEFEKVRYHICSVDFDPDTRVLGQQVDTLFNAVMQEKSASFPRVSPDGRFLLYTLSDYGNFSIWHRDADLYLADLQTGESRPLVEVNSSDVESYHSWSSNGRWIVFSSRRLDGLYTRLFFAHIDEHGRASKPFLLPQQDPAWNDRCMQSFNIPEWITGQIKVEPLRLSNTAKSDQGIQVRFSE